jgi:pyruvate-ferredoxin/flavodoxin oxidoreductase
MLLDQLDVLGPAIPGATFLVNSPYAPEETWHQFPDRIQAQILQKQLSVYAINAYQVAREAGMGSHINTVMQTGFFALSKILPQAEAMVEDRPLRASRLLNRRFAKPMPRRERRSSP